MLRPKHAEWLLNNDTLAAEDPKQLFLETMDGTQWMWFWGGYGTSILCHRIGGPSELCVVLREDIFLVWEKYTGPVQTSCLGNS